MLGILKAAAVGVGIIGDLIGSRREDEGQAQINAGRRDLARVENFQRQRKEIADFRTAQANAVLTGFANGAEGESSRAQGDASSIGTQAQLLQFERRLQSRLDDQIGFGQDRIRSGRQFSSLSQGASSVLNFYAEGGITRDTNTNIFQE